MRCAKRILKLLSGVLRELSLRAHMCRCGWLRATVCVRTIWPCGIRIDTSVRTPCAPVCILPTTCSNADVGRMRDRERERWREKLCWVLRAPTERLRTMRYEARRGVYINIYTNNRTRGEWRNGDLRWNRRYTANAEHCGETTANSHGILYTHRSVRFFFVISFIRILLLFAHYFFSVLAMNDLVP